VHISRTIVLRMLLVSLPLLALEPVNGDQAEHRYVMVTMPPPLIEKLSLNEARSIFSMRVHSWPDGSPIMVFVQPDDSSAHQEFVRGRLELLPRQLRRNWERLVYTGIGKAPIEVADENAMLTILLATPGAVGYLSLETFKDKGAQLHAIELY